MLLLCMQATVQAWGVCASVSLQQLHVCCRYCYCLWRVLCLLYADAADCFCLSLPPRCLSAMSQ
jgi:hypothetical protein